MRLDMAGLRALGYFFVSGSWKDRETNSPFSNSTVKGRVSSWPEAFLQVTVDWTVTRSSSEEV